PAQRQFERQQQARQKAALGGQHQPGADQYHANAHGLGALCRLFPGNTQLAGEVFTDRRRVLVQHTLTAIAVPTHRRTGNQHTGFLLATFQPGEQGFGQADPAAPQLCLAPVGPGPINNGRTGEVDHRIDRIRTDFLEPTYSTYLDSAEFGHLVGSTTPHSQTMAPGQPVSTELTSYQTSTAGQQYVHDIFLAWRFTRITSLFL